MCVSSIDLQQTKERHLRMTELPPVLLTIHTDLLVKCGWGGGGGGTGFFGLLRSIVWIYRAF